MSESDYSEGDILVSPERKDDVIEIVSSPESEEKEWDGESSEIESEEEEDYDEREDIPKELGLKLVKAIVSLVEKERVARRLPKYEVERQMYYTLVDLWKMRLD